MTPRGRELVAAWLVVATLGLAIAVLPTLATDRASRAETLAGATTPGRTGWQSQAALTGVPAPTSDSTLAEDDRPVWQRGHMAARDDNPPAPPAGTLCLAGLRVDTPSQRVAAPESTFC